MKKEKLYLLIMLLVIGFLVAYIVAVQKEDNDKQRRLKSEIEALEGVIQASFEDVKALKGRIKDKEVVIDSLEGEMQKTAFDLEETTKT